MKRFARVAAAPLLVISLCAVLRTPAQTVPLYAARTGNLCSTCHFDPNGGGPRNEFGFAFARNRHSLEADPDTTSSWHDLQLTNKIGETMPVFIGVNQRFMLLANNAGPPEGLDRLGFFNMENAIHLAFQPHPRLTLVYSQDVNGFSATNESRLRDAWGMIGGFPWNGYLRAGRFRNPFGLRLDDHTVATRNGFLDFANQERFLPYDPRTPDMGVEIGAQQGIWYGRAAYTNGNATSTVLSGNHYAEGKAVKFGVNMSHYQSGLSFYDNYNKEPVGGAPKRATRWGYYGLTHYGPVAVIGEIAAGTDEDEPVVPGFASGPKTNRLAYFAEIDYAPWRFLNGRVRYDRLDYDRSSDPAIRDANTHQRYSVEAEYVPVPFAELRASVRRIVHEDEALYGFEDETQGFLQFHFSY